MGSFVITVRVSRFTISLLLPGNFMGVVDFHEEEDDDD